MNVADRLGNRQVVNWLFNKCNWHFGKIMIFPSNWQFLEYLHISFAQYCAQSLNNIEFIFELDEGILESIHKSHPLLTPLSLNDLFLNISD